MQMSFKKQQSDLKNILWFCYVKSQKHSSFVDYYKPLLILHQCPSSLGSQFEGRC
jgi:hypothetical protein